MKNLKVTLGALLLLLNLVSWWACNQDPRDLDATFVDVAFAGRIIDEAGAPVAAAQIQAGTETILTDDNGVFRTKKVKIPDNDAILSVSKIGYFEFSRAYFVKDESLQTVTIQLLKKVQAGTFDNASGGTVSIPGGPTLKFPANSVNTSGTIRVFARYLNPSDNALALFTPGDFRGINTSGTEQTLGSYGMVAVELEGAGGKAQIADGKEVELTMPILSTQAAQAPAEIPLWYFDTAKSRWVEEGSAQKTGNQYVGKVKHFSFWNCDVGLSLVQLNGSVFIGDLQHPLANATVKLVTSASGWPGYANTDVNGQFGGGVIQNVEMELSVLLYDQCGGQFLYTQTIGPFNSDVTLPPIILNTASSSAVTVTGTLEDCTGDPVANAYVKVNISIVFADENGIFTLNTFNCSGTASVQVHAFDLDNLKESPIQTYNLPSNGTIDIGTLTVCTGLDEFIQYTIDGETTTMPDPYGALLDSLNGQMTVYLYTFNGTINSISMQFEATQTGTYPMQAMRVNNYNVPAAQCPNITTNLTTFPANQGDYFIGTFSGTFLDIESTSHTVSGNYRVKRE